MFCLAVDLPFNGSSWGSLFSQRIFSISSVNVSQLGQAPGCGRPVNPLTYVFAQTGRLHFNVRTLSPLLINNLCDHTCKVRLLRTRNRNQNTQINSKICRWKCIIQS